MQPIIVKTFTIRQDKLLVILAERGRSHWVDKGPPMQLNLGSGKEPAPPFRLVAVNRPDSRKSANAKLRNEFSSRQPRHIVGAAIPRQPDRAKGTVRVIESPNSIELRAELETDTTLAGYADVHESWNDLLTWLSSEEPASAPVAAEPTAGSVVVGPLEEKLVTTEGELLQAIYALPHESSNKEWWRSVAFLYWRYKRQNIKMTYTKISELLGLTDHKYVGERLREHKPPKTTQNHP